MKSQYETKHKPINHDRDYTDEEREFLVAVDAFKRKTGKLFPSLTDLLGIVRSLGYRKQSNGAIDESRNGAANCLHGERAQIPPDGSGTVSDCQDK